MQNSTYIFKCIIYTHGMLLIVNASKCIGAETVRQNSIHNTANLLGMLSYFDALHRPKSIPYQITVLHI